MIHLSARSECALLALIYLARCDADDFVSVESIACAQEIPPRFLEQILLALKRTKVLRGAKGQCGGYQLAKPGDKISLAEIIRLFDGALAPGGVAGEDFYTPAAIEREAGLQLVFEEIQDHVSQTLESTTLADVARQP